MDRNYIFYNYRVEKLSPRGESFGNDFKIVAYAKK